MRYVAAFLFSPDLRRVALICKNKPAWQRGKLNAIGGKVEENEDLSAAARREFEEETGVLFDGWKFFLALKVPPSSEVVHFCAGVSELVWRLGSPTSETVFLVDVNTIEHDRIAEGEPVPLDGGGWRALYAPLYNVPWLVRMAVDYLKNGSTYEAEEKKSG